MVCQRGAVRVRRSGGQGRAGQGRNARGRGARRVGDAGRWVVSGVRCGFGDAAGRGVTRGWSWFGVGLALVWRHRGDGYFLQFIWHPNRPSRAL